MTQIAQADQISRTCLYQRLLAANLQLAVLFSDEKRLFQKDHRHLEQWLLLLRLEGQCALLSMASMVKALEYHPNSVGYLRQCFHSAGQALPSPLLMPAKTWVFYLSEEIFALHAPILVTLDARSTTILNIELASERSADTWRAHFEALEEHHFFSLGMASDRGRGLVAGYRAAVDMAWWGADYVHEFRDRFVWLQHLERNAYAAIGKAYDAAHKLARAQSEANRHTRLQHYDTAHHAAEQAMALYDQLARLLHLLRETLHLCSPHGRLRTVEGVRAALTRLCDMLAALDCAALARTLKPLHQHLDDMLVPFAPAEAIEAALRAVVPHEACEALVLAWHPDHLVDPSPSQQQRYHQSERACWLAYAEGLLGDAFDTLKALVFDTLDSMIRASSLVEMVNSLLRPYLKSGKGQITPETRNLILFSHNHRRDKSGQRTGKAPIALWTGKPLEAEWWALLLQQVKQEADAPDHDALPSRPAWQLIVDNREDPDRQTIMPGPGIVEHTGASGEEVRQTTPQAA